MESCLTQVPLKVGTKCSIFHPMHKRKVVAEGILGVNGSSKMFRNKDLTQLCAKGWQMVMVTKVFKPTMKFVVVKPSVTPIL